MNKNNSLLRHNDGENDEKVTEMALQALEAIREAFGEDENKRDIYNFLRYLVITATPAETVNYPAVNGAVKRYCAGCGCELTDFYTTNSQKIVHCILCGKRIKGHPIETKVKRAKVTSKRTKEKNNINDTGE